MLIKASIENFKSFNKRAELNLISSSKIQSHSDHKVKIKQTTLLKNSVIYGANASGKSNLIEFFHFFKWTVSRGLPIESREFFSRIEEENRDRDSEFEIQFAIDDKFYAYGFTSRLQEGTITGEWLYELKQDGNAGMVFQWERNKKPELGSQIKLGKDERKRFEVYAEDYLSSVETLFLTEMNRNKKYSQKSKLLFFSEIYDWITNNIVVITPNTKIANFQYYYDQESLVRVNELIREFDTGISEVCIKNIDLEEMRASIPREIYEDIVSEIEKSMKEEAAVQMTMRSQTDFFNIVLQKNEELEVSTICMKHGRSKFDFRFEEESDGTRRVFELMDMLLSKKDNVVYIVDELERSLHPKLTERFLELFMKIHQRDKAQLIFSTHEASIMDTDLFRRDEVWFVERDINNNSNIYSLDRFKERYDKKLSKAYLDGRYGAVPIFKSFEFADGE
ncbi:MAG: ATP-binding protein [Peptostreptococcaceae bacterium]|nr:ATP-binding protein [Peptostreptococcaceae bacterium]